MAVYNIHNQAIWAWRLTKGYRPQITLYIVLEIVSLALSLSFVYWSKQAVDIATNAQVGSLRAAVGFIVASVFLSVLLGQLASWLNERTKIRLVIRLQNSLVFSQMRVVWENTKRWHTGDLLVRIHTDSKEAVQMVVYTLPNLCVTVVRLSASWAFLWSMDAWLAGMILAISPLFLFAKLYYRRMRRLSREVKEAESRFGVVLQENLKQRLLIRALEFVQVRKMKYLEEQGQIHSLKDKQLKFSIVTQTLLKFVFNSGYLLAFLWGVYHLHTGLIPFGTLTAFLQLVGRVQDPVLSMIAFVPAAIRCRTTFDRLMDLYEGRREAHSEMMPISRPAFLRFDKVAFRYDDRKVISGLSVELASGVPVAIVGATGKGKTTLIRLMLALVEPQEGVVQLVEANGQTNRVSVHTRGHFSYVPQGNTLFCGTIRENLLMACPQATEEQLKEMLHLACADFVYTLPQGIDTWVGESGHGLSEGQAQRIAIARALLRDTGIWLFDEATSALDADTAVRLVHNLLEAGRQKILIFVTHDPRLMQACRQVITLDE